VRGAALGASSCVQALALVQAVGEWESGYDRLKNGDRVPAHQCAVSLRTRANARRHQLGERRAV
jgi:hypothetical protein